MSSTSRPEPVTRAATIAGAVSALIIAAGGLARAAGWLSDDLDVHAVARQASDLILGAAVLWSTVAPLALAMWARGRVTPLADPRDAAGHPLVPAGGTEGEHETDDVEDDVEDDREGVVAAATAVLPAAEPAPPAVAPAYPATVEIPAVPAPQPADTSPIHDELVTRYELSR
jgi:hypothetical protein